MGEELDQEILKEFPPYEVEELTKEEILGDTVINYLVSLEDSADKIRAIERVKEKAKEFKILRAFNDILKIRNKQNTISKNSFEKRNGKAISFKGLNDLEYITNRYEIDKTGAIYEIIPDVGRILVCYHPILPVEKYNNIEDGTEKIKLAFYKNSSWKTIIVDKSVIASNQKIVNLSDFGIAVTSENAKFLVKYLSEIENMNQDKIKTQISVSRLGWFDNLLIPYSNGFEFDNDKDIPYLKEKFGESGKLEDWVEFLKERRKYNSISRIVMAAGVASILLKDLKQNGFTVHVYGESEVGKSVCCMVAQSIFGNPSQSDNKGIGINFNFTNVGLEYRLNLYNNIPLFINEMQHQKDAKDYDKMLFLISEGKGKSRGTKTGGIGKENSWNNVVVTNGEKNIIKDNSNAGAYNRCIACEMREYSYENLSEVADFVKENYGTPIRKILAELKTYNYKEIYKEKLKEVDYQDITNKQKILEAILLTADKILVDIIFKDEYYLKPEDFEDKTISKKDVAIDERAYSVVRDWFISEKRHFLMQDQNEIENTDLKVEIYGKEMTYGYIAIIPSVLKKVLEDDGYDFNEVLKAWRKRDYVKHDEGKNTMSVRINGGRTRCVVLDMKKDIENEELDEEEMILPF